MRIYVAKEGKGVLTYYKQTFRESVIQDLVSISLVALLLILSRVLTYVLGGPSPWLFDAVILVSLAALIHLTADKFKPISKKKAKEFLELCEEEKKV